MINMDIEKRYFTEGQIEQIAHILGDTANGFTGSQIGHLLAICKIEDVNPDYTKWMRLYNAFIKAHDKYGRDNFILKFIAKSLEPARFTHDPGHFKYLIKELNSVLAFQGIEYQEDGKFHNVKKVTTLSEAEERGHNLRRTFQERNYHPELEKYCKAELLENNYFHAVLESIKGLASIIRDKADLKTDGTELIEEAFCGKSPVLLINNGQAETEISEQKGFSNLLKGLFGTFRNPTAHAARIEWSMEKQDALDLFAIASYAYRRIENSKKNTIL
jgi:uncharacterized protein (TIGR02391 family)